MPINSEAPVVFVIDDDAAVREALADLFASVGLGVETFGSTGDFLRRTRPDHPSAPRYSVSSAI